MDAITIELMEKEATANVRRGKVTEITNAHTHTHDLITRRMRD